MSTRRLFRYADAYTAHCGTAVRIGFEKSYFFIYCVILRNMQKNAVPQFPNRMKLLLSISRNGSESEMEVTCYYNNIQLSFTSVVPSPLRILSTSSIIYWTTPQPDIVAAPAADFATDSEVLTINCLCLPVYHTRYLL